MIRYVVGDATVPKADGPKIIAHVVNTSGGWGRGFVVAVSKRWQEPEAAYRRWHSDQTFTLGSVQLVKVEADLAIANMLAQRGYSYNGKPAVVYDALRSCLEKVAVRAKEVGASVHMPRIGCGLAGGKWEEVEPILQEALRDVEVFVYDLPEEWEWQS